MVQGPVELNSGGIVQFPYFTQIFTLQRIFNKIASFPVLIGQKTKYLICIPLVAAPIVHSSLSRSRVPKKLYQNCFCHNFVKFPPTLIIFGTLIAQRINLCKVQLFSTSPNSRQRLTVLNVDVKLDVQIAT